MNSSPEHASWLQLGNILVGAGAALLLRVVYEEFVRPWWIWKHLSLESFPERQISTVFVTSEPIVRLRIRNGSRFLIKGCRLYFCGGALGKPYEYRSIPWVGHEGPQVAWIGQDGPLDICPGEVRRLHFDDLRFDPRACLRFKSDPRHVNEPKDGGFHGVVVAVSESVPKKAWRVDVDVNYGIASVEITGLPEWRDPVADSDALWGVR